MGVHIYFFVLMHTLCFSMSKKTEQGTRTQELQSQNNSGGKCCLNITTCYIKAQPKPIVMQHSLNFFAFSHFCNSPCLRTSCSRGWNSLCKTIMFIDRLENIGEHRNFILQKIHITCTSVKVTTVWGCFLFFLVSKGGWMSLIVAITAVEHGGHHPPTQAIYICGCVLWLTATALWLRGKRRRSVKCWSAQAERELALEQASSVNHRWNP